MIAGEVAVDEDARGVRCAAGSLEVGGLSLEPGAAGGTEVGQGVGDQRLVAVGPEVRFADAVAFRDGPRDGVEFAEGGLGSALGWRALDARSATHPESAKCDHDGQGEEDRQHRTDVL